MRTLSKLLFVSIIASLPLSVACGSDDDDKPGGNTGGTGNTGNTGGTGNTGNSGGTGNAAGTGGTGGATEHADIPTQITGELTLTADKVWDLKDTTYVTDGATLTIEAGTRIEGAKSPLGTLVVSRGGKINAVGEADKPIVFTSALPGGSRAPGDWGGVILLGKAPNFKGDNVTIEGLADAPENQYGGSDPADSSGTLQYVRIEYSGFELSKDNEINGLTLGSVGSGTTIDHVMVSNTLDDGFEWFGGTVSASHLVVNNAGDDMFDMDQGFSGNLQFLFGRQVNPLTKDPNGIEADSSLNNDTPVTKPQVSNVTLCGIGTAGSNLAYGAVLRENLEGNFMNMIFTQFDVGVDARDEFGSTSNPKSDITDSVFFGNFKANISDPAETDNDSGFDENAWIKDAARMNTETDPGINCAANPPSVMPATEIAGGTPAGGLDANATYRGAFRDSSDNWMSGAWVSWDAN